MSDLNEQFSRAFASELTPGQLWLLYFSLGGAAGWHEVDAYLNGAMAMPPMQPDILAHAINERLEEMAPPRAPYSVEFVDQGPPDVDTE